MAKKKEQLLHFIESYRNLPELWDIECPSYSNRIKKAAAYDILIENLKPLESDANRESVVKKINNLRSTFQKKLKKVNDSKRSGMGSDDIYVPSLWYFNDLMFLVDKETPASSESTFNKADNDKEDLVSALFCSVIIIFLNFNLIYSSFTFKHWLFNITKITTKITHRCQAAEKICLKLSVFSL